MVGIVSLIVLLHTQYHFVFCFFSLTLYTYTIVSDFTYPLSWYIQQW